MVLYISGAMFWISNLGRDDADQRCSDSNAVERPVIIPNRVIREEVIRAGSDSRRRRHWITRRTKGNLAFVFVERRGPEPLLI